MVQRRRLAVGQVVAVPLPSGSFGLIFVIEASAEGDVTLLVLDGFWPNVPSAHEASSARPAKATGDDSLTSLLGYDDVWKGWFRGRIPADFQVVAERKPSAREVRYAKNISGTMIFGTAEGLRRELHNTWRFDHDKTALEAEWALAEAREERSADRRKAMTLSAMLRERIFVDWSTRWPPRVVREARRIFRDATKELVALESGGTKRARLKVLKGITTELNALDDREGFIETVEREELVARIEELASRVGLTNDEEELTGHRDW